MLKCMWLFSRSFAIAHSLLLHKKFLADFEDATVSLNWKFHEIVANTSRSVGGELMSHASNYRFPEFPAKTRFREPHAHFNE